MTALRQPLQRFAAVATPAALTACTAVVLVQAYAGQSILSSAWRDHGVALLLALLLGAGAAAVEPLGRDRPPLAAALAFAVGVAAVALASAQAVYVLGVSEGGPERGLQRLAQAGQGLGADWPLAAGLVMGVGAGFGLPLALDAWHRADGRRVRAYHVAVAPLVAAVVLPLAGLALVVTARSPLEGRPPSLLGFGLAFTMTSAVAGPLLGCPFGLLCAVASWVEDGAARRRAEAG